jgi:hypothetical protein
MSCRSVSLGDLRHDLAIFISVARRPNCWLVRRQRGLGRRHGAAYVRTDVEPDASRFTDYARHHVRADRAATQAQDQS